MWTRQSQPNKAYRCHVAINFRFPEHVPTAIIISWCVTGNATSMVSLRSGSQAFGLLGFGYIQRRETNTSSMLWRTEVLFVFISAYRIPEQWGNMRTPDAPQRS